MSDQSDRPTVANPQTVVPVSGDEAVEAGTTPPVEQRQPFEPMAWSLKSDDEVRALAQGCTELTCLYHGRFNEELRRRAREQREARRG